MSDERTSGGTGEATLGRAEVQAVLQRAAALHREDEAPGDDAPGLSERELEAVAREAGLPAQHVQTAVGELRAGVLRPAGQEDAPRRPYLLGGAAALDQERVVQGTLDEDAFGALVLDVHEAVGLGPPGRLEQHGRSLAATYGGGAARFTLTTEHDRTRLRLRSNLRYEALAAHAITAVIYAISVAATGPSLGIALAVAGALLLAVRLLVSWRIDRRERQIEDLLDQLAERVRTAESGAQPAQVE